MPRCTWHVSMTPHFCRFSCSYAGFKVLEQVDKKAAPARGRGGEAIHNTQKCSKITQSLAQCKLVEMAKCQKNSQGQRSSRLNSKRRDTAHNAGTWAYPQKTYRGLLEQQIGGAFPSDDCPREAGAKERKPSDSDRSPCGEEYQIQVSVCSTGTWIRFTETSPPHPPYDGYRLLEPHKHKNPRPAGSSLCE